MTMFDDDGAELRRVLKDMRDEQDRRHEALLAKLAEARDAEPEAEPFGPARLRAAYAEQPSPAETRKQRKERQQ